MKLITKQSDIRLSLITSYDQLKILFCEFEKANKKQSLLDSTVWLITWYNYYWQKQWRLHSLAYYHDDKLVSLVPFFIKKSSLFPLVKTLHLIGQGEAEYAEVALEYLDIYIKPAYEKTVYPLLINEINKLNFDQFIVKAIFENSHIANILPHIKGVLTRQHYAQYRVNNTHWQLAQLSKNNRSRINRCKNQLTKLNATVRWLNLDEYNSAWALLKSYHQSRWQNKGKAGAFVAAEFNQFHKTLREKNSNTVAMSAVFIGEQPIAIHYYLVTEDTYFFYQSGWDEKNFAKLSPGLFLHYWSITHCPKKYYDFMMGGVNNSYKAKFNADTRAMTSITLVKNPIKLFVSKIVNKLTHPFN
ncbi:GNAT family N-acetyltransferase [Colwellia sp. MB02u-6]|uniref:GNAT family N-acetyltransferase n=1 Tax=Colwellia sp. MB02u-6 TaxID=2759824 RepID=UPI0015F6911E|nr:GNAT family N-acetyltransferase [Colwellia sp. MB02u-6]MBA6328721.1 GNAT family N-acetyltransferase [Colwellia sp. MB02u-6]